MTRATTRTDPAGQFSLTLAYGTYTIRATNAGGYRSTASKQIDLHSASITIELTVDSGIR